MVRTPLRALLLIAGVLVAGVLVYLTGVLGPEGAEPQTAVNAPPVSEPSPPAEPATKDKAAEAPVVAEAGEQKPADKEQVVVPAFDLLRAEPNGSVVIAGRAEAGAEVEIVSGSSVLAKAQAGPAGDFAAVLDEPLKPGEHNIVLRARSKDNVAATSLETAIVSVPTAKSGQVVALVQQPGEPSRLITVPEPQAPQPKESAGETDARADPPASGAETSGQGGGTAPSAGAGEGSGNGSAAPVVAEAKPDVPAGTDAGKEQAPAGSGEASTENPEAPEEAAPFIEAVEIDGRDVFVAGRAKPESMVRVYANDVLLGQATASPEGRFLIEAERDLPVGDYIVRADVLADDEGTVVARAAVPFERHEGEKIAAVAPQARSGSAAAGEGAEKRPQAGGTTDGQASAGSALPEAQVPAGTAANADGAASAGSASDVRDRIAATGSKGLEDDTRAERRALSETVSPALEPVDGSVIIRRGDTLWHISRRVYGRGIRYTTIYLANQDQIRDPDRIWPGQIFTVPDETKDGEKADLDAIGGQALKPESTARETR